MKENDNNPLGLKDKLYTIEEFGAELSIIDALASKTGFLSSNGEARRELKANAIAVNKEKVGESFMLTKEHLINDRYILFSKGKKNNYILILE